MKKTLFSAALLAGITFSSCSAKTTENTEATADNTEMQHNGMDMQQETMETEAMPTSVVVETPDYTAVAEPVKAQVAALLDAYLKLKDALVASDAAAAKTAANKVFSVAGAIPVASLQDEQKAFAEEKTAQIKESAEKIAAASDVDAQRASLEPLSEATFALTKAFDATGQKLYYQRCPMANNNEGGYWLSVNQEIRNPYFGEQMLKCGSTEEVLN
ncbi:DUF3347 domain-containing protein [Pontibacter sp. 172403-2]|uniref:DUF3347 domain-containing protein n=1 Tax=Pontibacter rufus TaxID=2791028 RepID=UPI0018AF7112|nr:DUF3347 domain-containing protein [Pontibacter sp. 172403-2]MBF9252205.1 DUF3347 domain-containing protein [Pontibacter sp. 172403-2]